MVNCRSKAGPPFALIIWDKRAEQIFDAAFIAAFAKKFAALQSGRGWRCSAA